MLGSCTFTQRRSFFQSIFWIDSWKNQICAGNSGYTKSHLGVYILLANSMKKPENQW